MRMSSKRALFSSTFDSAVKMNVNMLVIEIYKRLYINVPFVKEWFERRRAVMKPISFMK